MFTLPPLPYPDNALDPVISANTLSFHYGKHHKAYVDNLNNLAKGTEYESAPLEKVIRDTAGKADDDTVEAPASPDFVADEFDQPFAGKSGVDRERIAAVLGAGALRRANPPQGRTGHSLRRAMPVLVARRQALHQVGQPHLEVGEHERPWRNSNPRLRRWPPGDHCRTTLWCARSRPRHRPTTDYLHFTATTGDRMKMAFDGRVAADTMRGSVEIQGGARRAAMTGRRDVKLRVPAVCHRTEPHPDANSGSAIYQRRPLT